MFFEPNSNPPRLSMARIMSWPCSFLGFLLMARGAWLVNTEILWSGCGVLGFAVVLFTLVEWRRVKFGEAEIERGDDDPHEGECKP